MASNMISFETFSIISNHKKVEYHIQRNTSNQGFSIHKPQVQTKSLYITNHKSKQTRSC